MKTEPTTLKHLARKLRLSVTYGARLDHDKQSEWQQNANGYHCTLRYRGRQYSFDYWMGVACRGEPDVESVLDSLLLDASAGEQPFEEFCSEFGYDPDSRKAEAIHTSCQKTAKAIRRLLGSEFETFLCADRD